MVLYTNCKLKDRSISTHHDKLQEEHEGGQAQQKSEHEIKIYAFGRIACTQLRTKYNQTFNSKLAKLQQKSFLNYTFQLILYSKSNLKSK